MWLWLRATPTMKHATATAEPLAVVAKLFELPPVHGLHQMKPLQTASFLRTWCCFSASSHCQLPAKDTVGQWQPESLTLWLWTFWTWDLNEIHQTRRDTWYKQMCPWPDQKNENQKTVQFSSVVARCPTSSPLKQACFQNQPPVLLAWFSFPLFVLLRAIVVIVIAIIIVTATIFWCIASPKYCFTVYRLQRSKTCCKNPPKPAW